MTTLDLPEAALAVIRDHLREVHGRELAPSREISARGHVVDDAPIAYIAGRGLSMPQFTCTECPGRSFPAGDPDYGDPYRNSLLRAVVPEVRAAVSGVRGRDDVDLVTEAWDRGELGAITVRDVRRTRAMRTRRVNRPNVDKRRANCQEFLLSRVRDGAKVAAAIDAFERLRDDDPDRYKTLLNGAHYRARSTLEQDWRKIPLGVRDAARREGEAAHKARRPRKSTP